MKILILILTIVSFSFSQDYVFKKSSLNQFKIQGYYSKIIYKNKSERDLQIAELWNTFLSSKEYDIKQSIDKKLYVIYSDYKPNSFDCFIGIKANDNIKNSKHKIIPKSNYLNTIITYKKGMNISKVWDEMQKQKLNRNFKMDIEEYKLEDLHKNSYSINIYLSSK